MTRRVSQPKRPSHQRRQNRCERPQRVAAVDHDVVPSHRPRTAVVSRRRREQGLLECRRGSTVAPHSIDQGDHRYREEDRQRACNPDRYVASAGQ